MSQSEQVIAMKKTLIYIFLIFVISALFIFFGNALFITFENNEDSECYGVTKNGKLVNGKRLPSSGDNFVTYSYLGSTIGRTCVHSKVKDIIRGSYSWLYQNNPEKKFIYGETGWPSGGKFWPHKTHQNGLSVDFMVPLIDKSGHSVEMKTNIFNKWGYNVEFDSKGRFENLKIDYEAMAMHIYALKIKAKEDGVKIWRVIFDPKLQKYLFNTKYGKKIRDIQFSRKRSWVRHDDHYHVDFEITCNKL